MRLICILSAALLSAASASTSRAAGKAAHIVVVVWDGMRPDFISASNTPTLFSLAHQGVWFDNHHPVFVSVTEPNGTSIATGAYPGHHGIYGDTEFRSDLNPLKGIHPEQFDTVRQSDALTHGHHVLVPTVAEILHARGIRTAIAGTKPIALLYDRTDRPDYSPNPVLFAGRTLPTNLLDSITSLHGSFPNAKSNTTTGNDWTTEALVDSLWSNGVPAFSLLWMNEPDASQHNHAPGSPEALAGIRNNDDNLARVLKTLDTKGVRKDTDIMIVSDHGFSTIQSIVDVAESLRNAGFTAVREFKMPPKTGNIMVVGNGGATFLYVIGHDKKVIGDVVKFLQSWNYTGVIFAKERIEGAFTLAQIHLDSPTAPDVVISFRWNASVNDFGTPGLMISDASTYKPGQGMHGSLSLFEMHNTFIAAGPDFRVGVVDHMPTGNVDIAPTALWILGIKQPKSMDGRVVLEAMTGPHAEIKSFEPNHLEATRDLGNSVWRQYINFTTVNGVDYFDEGNGAQIAK